MSRRYFLAALICLALAFAGCGQESQPVSNLPEFCQQEKGKLYLKQGPVKMEIMPEVGGRISSLSYDGHELLVQVVNSDKNTDWGTVLWSSPQAEWKWPPLATLDHHPYKISAKGDRVTLTSEIDPSTGYQFSKTYMPAGEDRFAVTYRIFNHSPVEKSVAPLEVTRLPSSGALFYPHGDSEAVSGMFYPLDVQTVDSLTWFAYDPKKIRTDHHKIMQDGKEGWFAYVDRGYLLMKEFVDNPPSAIAEGEREIEIFAHVAHVFVEMKQQGAAVTLSTGEHLEWTVIWHVKKLPDELAANPEPLALAAYARSLL